MDEFVNLFPIHPAYIDVFNKVYLIENRHILKNISLSIKDIFDNDVPENAPGIISFDDYWPSIKSNGLLRSDVTISRVLNASKQLEEIVARSFSKEAYKPMAIQIIYALSVHRLTTNGLDVHFGLTAENLKDDICLYLPMPEEDSDFLLGAVKATLKEILKTVSGQFIIHDEDNGQYFIDVDKIVDYEERIKQKASLLADGELNRYFYHVVYGCLEWDRKQYVSGFEIYEHDLNWDSHNIFREGYLFMGLPGERSTAQPERDFYMHIMPPYGYNSAARNDAEDEVYFYFKSSDEFRDMLSHYASAQSLASISEGKDKEAYLSKASKLYRKLVRFLSENNNTCFDVVYKKERRQLIEVLKGRYKMGTTFNDTIDLAASICIDEYFNRIYQDIPVMKTKITRKNMAENAKAAFEHFAGRTSQQSTMMLESFGVLDGDKIRPEGSKYAAYYINLIQELPTQGVLNFTDIFEQQGNWQIDKKFRIWYIFTPIIFLSMVYSGHAVITLRNNETITASNLDRVFKLSSPDLYEFKYLSRPTEMSIVELKKLFDILKLNPAKLNNPNNREAAVEDLLRKAYELTNATVQNERTLSDKFELWGEPLASAQQIHMMRDACAAVKNEFSNYGTRFNTPAKLNNFRLSSDEVEKLGKDIALLQRIPQYQTFKTDCASVVSYISSIEYIDLGAVLKSDIENAKATFREVRDDIMEGTDGDAAAQKVCAILEKIKDKYIDIYFENHKKKRFGMDEANRKGKIQESQTLSNLRKLRSIEILSSAKLSDIEQDLARLKVCYSLTSTDLKANTTCPHCKFSLDDNERNVYGQLDNIEDRIDNLVVEWTKLLLDSISDPIVENQKKYLSASQIKVIDDFIASGTLPQQIDGFFIESVLALLKSYEPVVILVYDLIQKLEELPPMDEANFIAKLGEIVSAYTKGKDATKLRIVVKRRENEE
ncbi:MAG: hypothetical protein GX802_07495 [Clostridiales bacterium]|nr:hypothetical protein [Clostridiales bacterium]